MSHQCLQKSNSDHKRISFCSVTTETGHISPAVWLPVGVLTVSPGRGNSVDWVWWAGRCYEESGQALALKTRTAMTPCPSPGPPGNPGHPEANEKRMMRKWEQSSKMKFKMCFFCDHAHVSNLIWVQEKLYKLTANHGELPGLWMIQCQPCVQLTTGLIKVQQPPHKSASHRQ